MIQKFAGERWRINLYTLWVTQVFSLMGFGFCLPFTPFLLQTMGIHDPIKLHYYVGLAATIPAATMAVSAPIWGMLADRYGRKLMILRAMLTAAFLLALMGLSQTVWQFLILRALQGIFSGTVTASMSFVSANTPSKRISYALGLMTSSNFLGYSLGPFFGGLLAEALGYRICFFIGGGLMLIGFFLVFLFVQEDPNSYGKTLSHDTKTGWTQSFRVLSPLVLLLLLALLLQRVVRTVFVPFIPLYVQATLGTMTGAATYTGIINGTTGLCTAIAALTITRLGDRYDKIKLSLLLTVTGLPFAAGMVMTNAIPTFLVVYSVFYFLSGGAEPIMTSAATEKTPASMRGVLFGMIGAVGSIGAMVSPMIGSFVSVEYSLHAILVVMPLFAISQCICLGVAARPKFREITKFREP